MKMTCPAHVVWHTHLVDAKNPIIVGFPGDYGFGLGQLLKHDLMPFLGDFYGLMVLFMTRSLARCLNLLCPPWFENLPA
jgi:hypothetical protein